MKTYKINNRYGIEFEQTAETPIAALKAWLASASALDIAEIWKYDDWDYAVYDSESFIFNATYYRVVACSRGIRDQ